MATLRRVSPVLREGAELASTTPVMPRATAAIRMMRKRKRLRRVRETRSLGGVRVRATLWGVRGGMAGTERTYRLVMRV